MLPVPLCARLSLLTVAACTASTPLLAEASPSFGPTPASRALGALVGSTSDGDEIKSPDSEKPFALLSNVAGLLSESHAPQRALQDDAATTTGSLNWPLNSNDNIVGPALRATVTVKYPIKVPDVYYYVELGLAHDVLGWIWSEAIAAHVANSNGQTTLIDTISVIFSVPPRDEAAPSTTRPTPLPAKVVMSPLTVSYSILVPPGYTAEAVKQNLSSPVVSCQLQQDVRSAVKIHPMLTNALKDTADTIVVSSCLPLSQQQGAASFAVPLGIALGIVVLCGVIVAMLCLRRRSQRREEDKGEGQRLDEYKVSEPQLGDFYADDKELKDAHCIVPCSPGAHGMQGGDDDEPVGELILPVGPGLTAAVVQPWLQNVYARHNPTNLYRVDELLDEHRGREADLVEAVSNKYRLGATDFERHYARSQRMGDCATCGVWCSPSDPAGTRPMFAQSLGGSYRQDGGELPDDDQEKHSKLAMSAPPSHAPSRPSRS